MSTTIIIIVVFVFLILIFVLLSRKNAKRNMNPIDSITFKGTLGLRRGDSYKFVLSRLKWLNLPTKTNDFDESSFLGEWGMGRIEIVDDYWGLIHEVSFGFKGKQLDSVYMKMNYTDYGIEELFGIVKTRITRVLKIDPMYTSDDFVKWGSNNNSGAVSLSIKEGDLLVMVLPD